ncbi:alpha/beta fold hydrolase [Paractinoplanes atraurantiacus]|uniref:Pimeloyl-ACP methyl ester carboxylesterase n=1 Tax=Paractinoplanes atraurantiacus TaxID=1036182 RepID=A0A285K4G1_9ACTN|nr:alpha/beta hydrolase [Actinoplanes atraurantiacus]SNY67153.1 Pimeloyl-ACP methyl ester carboxylesterase [Actinoplanes atraurantiacus]
MMVFPDGRRTTIRDGGDPAGRPVLFHHGTPSTRLAAGLVDAAAVRHGVRLVSFDRPGYAGADDSPPGLASVGRDAIAVADALGLDRFATVGVSGGGPYALATALAAPGRVTAVAVVAGIGPWRLINPVDPGDEERDLLAQADAGDTAAALAGFRRGLASENGDILAIVDDEALVDAYLDGAPSDDLKWLDAPKRRLWAADMRAGLPSLDGYARDNVSWGGVWDIDVTAVTVPVHLFYGSADRLVPPSHGRWLADRLPEATLTTFPGAGHGTASYDRWDEIFAAL